MSLQDNDVAFFSRVSSHSMAINATCQGFDDAQLEVLTQHLLIGFTSREKVEQRRQMLDGRESIWSHYRAKLDGVEREMLLVTVKKDNCVFDFSYLAAAGQYEPTHTEFISMVEGFHLDNPP